MFDIEHRAQKFFSAPYAAYIMQKICTVIQKIRTDILLYKFKALNSKMCAIMFDLLWNYGII